MINQFQNHVNGFMRSNLTKEQQISNWAMGLSGEVGETVDLLKKHLFHGKDLDVIAVKKELGDVLWYVFALASTLNLSIEDVMQMNIDKLNKRHDGSTFNIEAANVNKPKEKN